MKRKYKLKKSAIVIICLFLIFLIALLIFIISLFKTKSYSLEYNIKDYKISENYDNKEKIFYYEIVYNDIKYNFIYNSKYLKETKLIQNIEEYTEEEYTCLIVESNYIETQPLCSEGNNKIDVHLVPSSLQEKLPVTIKTPEIIEEKYENYHIYNTENKIFIWSYKGFNYINGTEREFIKLFDKDIYEIPLATKINNYIVIPDYEQSYAYNKVYILDINTLEVEEWKLKYDIAFDSYVLGTNDKSIYIIDKKNEIEYELVPHKKKMRIVGTTNKQGVVYNNDELEKIAIKKLISSTYTFTYKNNYHYTIEENTLYLSYLDTNIKTKVSNLEVSSIVSINQDTVYYLVKDTLYKYNLSEGETKLITYTEWERNNKNLIFMND